MVAEGGQSGDGRRAGNQDRLCVCGCPERSHSERPIGQAVKRICYGCKCPDFLVDKRSLSLTDRLADASAALRNLLDEVNTYQGINKSTGMAVWSSGDDLKAHGQVMEAFEIVETLRANLAAGTWIGRSPN